jgi:ribosome biogenesis protein ENP2
MSTGTYKPQIHTHYLPHLSLSFARHTSSLNQTFRLLSTDYSKSIHLQSDRTIELHTRGGLHHSIRIPRYGRDLISDRRTAEILVPSVGLNPDGMGECYRLDLQEGRFKKSYEIDLGGDTSGGGLQGGIDAPAVTTGAIAEESHGLVALGKKRRDFVGVLCADAAQGQAWVRWSSSTHAQETEQGYYPYLKTLLPDILGFRQ